MKRRLVASFLLMCGAVVTPIIFAKKHELSFVIAKDDVWSLSESFIALLSKTFDVDIFLETGTGFGGTTACAARYFKEVYTIELEEQKYKGACARFQNVATVHPLQGDSGIVFGKLLPKLAHKKILFWLDGHYSGVNAGRETNTTPIMQELEAIRQAGITDAVILVDDMCCFAPPVANPPAVAQGYPTVQELRDAILAINRSYEFYIYGDIAIACLPSEGVTFSSLVKAMTESRLFSAHYDATYESAVAAEYKLTTCATAEEKEALNELMVEHAGREWSVYPFLWYGLVNLGAKDSKALNYFLTTLKAGYTDIRVYWYCQNSIQIKPEDVVTLSELVKRNDPWLANLRQFIDERLDKLLK